VQSPASAVGHPVNVYHRRLLVVYSHAIHGGRTASVPDKSKVPIINRGTSGRGGSPVTAPNAKPTDVPVVFPTRIHLRQY
jgi:hypothetical protein